MHMQNEDLSFNGNNPGAVRFGNFINYYSFHSANERINNLDPKMLPTPENKTIVGLDIGCNTGNLTQKLYIYLKSMYPNLNVKILAIDIDPILIERANEENDNCDISFVASDIISNSSHKLLEEFKIMHNKQLFDIIFCFSVTMWIHINNGDKEFIRFLNILQNMTRTLIIEPQPWKCYKNAQRRMKRSGKSFELYESLKFRENVDKKIEEILCNNNFRKGYESKSSSWDRKIQSYHLVKEL